GEAECARRSGDGARHPGRLVVAPAAVRQLLGADQVRPLGGADPLDPPRPGGAGAPAKGSGAPARLRDVGLSAHAVALRDSGGDPRGPPPRREPEDERTGASDRPLRAADLPPRETEDMTPVAEL